MICHGNSKNEKGSHNHSLLKHMLHMAICCGLSIIIVGALPIIARFSPAAAGIIGMITPFLCPIMMLLMLPVMLRGDKKTNCCSSAKESSEPQK